MRSNEMRKAFTMIELLFVIVVLGIVGGFALELIRQYYEGIYRTQEYTKRVTQADQILDQLTKYFETAIGSSIVNLDRGTTTDCYGSPVGGDTNDYTVAFIGVDEDSLRGINGRPGWSEETLLEANNVLRASDANYTMANTVITALGSTLTGSAIYDSDSADVDACTRFGLNIGATGSAGFHTISASEMTTLTLNTDNNATNGKRKYLLRTGYAFRVDDNGNFTMYSNFRPWVAGQRYNTAPNQNLLGQKVAHFYVDYDTHDFQANPDLNDRGLVWRLKVCMQGVDNTLNDTDDSASQICRERRVHVRY